MHKHKRNRSRNHTTHKTKIYRGGSNAAFMGTPWSIYDNDGSHNYYPLNTYSNGGDARPIMEPDVGVGIFNGGSRRRRRSRNRRTRTHKGRMGRNRRTRTHKGRMGRNRRTRTHKGRLGRTRRPTIPKRRGGGIMESVLYDVQKSFDTLRGETPTTSDPNPAVQPHLQSGPHKTDSY